MLILLSSIIILVIISHIESFKIMQIHRNYQIIIKYKNDSDIREQILFIKNKYDSNNKLNVDIDFNPLRV